MSRYARDDAGDVYETKRGDRWRVLGTNAKGRVVVKRAGHRYEGELQWSPEVLRRMKKIHAAEAHAVREAVEPIERIDKPGILDRIFGTSDMPIAPDPDGRQRRKTWVLAAEKWHGRIRVIHIVLARSKTRKCCHGCKARRDLTKAFYTPRNARRAQLSMARALRRPGVIVKVS